MKLSEKINKLHKEHKSAMEIAQELSISFKQVVHLMARKPHKTMVDGEYKRVWR